MGASEPLLPVRKGPARRLQHRFGAKEAAICVCHVTLSMSSPILLDCLKWHYGGTFPFSIPALTFYAYAFSMTMGIAWTLLSEHDGLQQLNRPDMLRYFCVAAACFTAGDILSFMSMEHLDPGTYSLTGKAWSIIVTVVMSRVLLRRNQSPRDYGYMLAIAAGTFIFCQQELQAHAVGEIVGPRLVRDKNWFRGLLQRMLAVLLTASGAVFQESLYTKDPTIPFMLQQAWMGCGALTTSFVVMRLMHGTPVDMFVRGFDDWRVIALLMFYVSHGLSAGLMVKHLGAISRALCVPVTLGGCYVYTVLSGSSTLAAGVLSAWLGNVMLICAFALGKAKGKDRLK